MAKVSAGWMDTFASLPADKVAADAVIGGVGGMGLNYAANASSGDSGGYLGSAVGGAAIGGIARGGLKKLGANRSERMATEAAEAAAARAERAAAKTANGSDTKVGLLTGTAKNITGALINNIPGLRRGADAAAAPGLAANNNFLKGFGKTGMLDEYNPSLSAGGNYQTRGGDINIGAGQATARSGRTSTPINGGISGSSQENRFGPKPEPMSGWAAYGKAMEDAHASSQPASSGYVQKF